MQEKITWNPQDVEKSVVGGFDVRRVLADRGKTHGDFTVQAAMSQMFKDVIKTSPNWDNMPPYQREAVEMIAHKLSRMLCGNPNELDHARDIAGYATLVVERLGGVE